MSEGEAATALRGGRSLALAVLCVILFLTFLDNTVVSVALGDIQSELHAGVSSLQWVVGAYALTFAGAMLGFGMVGDEFGRKRVMVIGIVIFLAGSIMSATAPNVGVLIAGRAVMGFGAAASEPGTLSMIRHIYTEERERAWALGVWTTVSGVALAMGPVIGGALIGRQGDWRAIFWFNLAVGALALVGALAVLPENADPDGHRVDIAGTVLGAARALGTGLRRHHGRGFVLQHGPGDPAALRERRIGRRLLLVGDQGTASPAGPQVPSRAEVPGRQCRGVLRLLRHVRGLFLHRPVPGGSRRVRRLSDRARVPADDDPDGCCRAGGRPARPSASARERPIFTGCLLFALGLAADLVRHQPEPRLPAAGRRAWPLTGIGVGSTVVPATSSALSAVPPERSGMAASTTNTSREIGAVTGVAVLGALVSAKLTADIIARLHALGLPKSISQIVINGVETGLVPSSGKTKGAGGAAGAGQGKLVQEVIQAAYSAFQSGLHAALYLSAILVLVAGVFSYFWLGRDQPAEPEASPAPVNSPA